MVSMKAVALLILCTVAAPAALAQDPDSVRVSLVVDGQAVVLTAEEESTFTALAMEGLRSSTYEADTSIATMATWSAAARGSRLQVTFVVPQPVAFRFGTAGPPLLQTLPVQELVLPVSRGARPPDYILIRSQGRIRAFAKFGPLVARLEQALTRLAP